MATTSPGTTDGPKPVGWPSRLTKARLHFVSGKGGTGKTTVALGLLAAFRAQGLSVHPFKSGPDYIDPAFHAVAAGQPSMNLDSWAMSPGRIAMLARGAEGADLVTFSGDKLLGGPQAGFIVGRARMQNLVPGRGELISRTRPQEMIQVTHT